MQLSLIYSFILFISGAVALRVIFLIWTRRKSHTGLTLILMMSSMVVWSWTYALHWLFPTTPHPFFWLDATYLGVVSIPVFVFVFAVQQANPGFRFRKSQLILLAIYPVMTLAILWTDSYHQWFFGGLRRPGVNSIYTGGVGYWLNIVYCYGLLAAALYLFVSSMIKSRGKIYRTQLILCTLGISFPIIASIVGVMGIHLPQGLDLIPFQFIITGIFFFISLRIYHLLDLTPIVHDVLLDRMVDGMIVLDTQNRIVDTNEVAARFLNTPKSALIGQPMTQIAMINRIFQDLSADLDSNDLPFEKILAIPYLNDLTLDIRINSLTSSRNELIGHLILWRDITPLKKIEDELRQANVTLQSQLTQIEVLQNTLLEQVIRDPLTGLFNRRFLEDTMIKEFARAERINQSISFQLLDIDHFKNINDQFGHDAGDMVLVKMASLIGSITRTGDWVVRFGGEEILLVLIGTCLEDAVYKAENLRAEIEKQNFGCPDLPIKITVSIGVSAYPNHGETWQSVIKAADEELYQAKASGRNCVCIKNAWNRKSGIPLSGGFFPASEPDHACYQGARRDAPQDHLDAG